MSNEKSSMDGAWDVVITPRAQAIAVDLRGVWRYRDLVWMFFKRDFIAFYKQTILGPLWYLIQPTLTAITYFVIFGKIANIPTGGLPPMVFYLSGIVLWSYFSNCLINNAEVFSKNAQLFGKIYFPRLVMPLSVVLSGLVAFIIQFVLLMVISIGFMLAGFPLQINWLAVALVPLIVLYVAGLSLGVGLIVSAMTVRFRDLAFAAGFVTQLWMFASPVVYPYSQIPEKYQPVFHLNPMTAPIESLRSALFGVGSVPHSIWLANIGITLALLIAGLILFTRAESNAMDTV